MSVTPAMGARIVAGRMLRSRILISAGTLSLQLNTGSSNGSARLARHDCSMTIWQRLFSAETGSGDGAASHATGWCAHGRTTRRP